jgi:branched-chain amino acid transport system ATP-binding protein
VAEERALREDALEILTLFGERLLPRLDQPAFSLSYANRRRIEIARAPCARTCCCSTSQPPG